jgi:hypothetical protein
MSRKFVKGPVIRPTARRKPRAAQEMAKTTPAFRGSIDDRSGFPDTVSASLAGRYAIWSPDGLRIVGSGSTLDEALAIAGLEDGRLVQRIPAAIRVRSLGGTEPRPVEG